MKSIIAFTALALCVNMAIAGGGKMQTQNPLYDDTGTVVGTVVPVPEACEVVIPQSGKAVYIVCSDDTK
ncbi:MAG: hypothetical protein QNJ78_11105 [Gammaproteobacteria bacterium]|nr:hypothetical protein [Gammaproteobacteria bacterium]